MRGKWIRRKITGIPKDIYEIKRKIAKKRLKYKDFSIISNNCWAGSVYRYFDIPYNTPTVGLYFFAADYIKFIDNLKYYFSLELDFITYEQSKYKDDLIKRNQTGVPIARLDDIEIIFLHYKTVDEAREKWERRKKRINYDNIILKFSQMNLCTQKELEAFDCHPFPKKFVFVTKKKHGLGSGIYFSGFEDKDEISLDSRPFPKDINILKLLNTKPCKY